MLYIETGEQQRTEAAFSTIVVYFAEISTLSPPSLSLSLFTRRLSRIYTHDDICIYIIVQNTVRRVSPVCVARVDKTPLCLLYIPIVISSL